MYSLLDFLVYPFVEMKNVLVGDLDWNNIKGIIANLRYTRDIKSALHTVNEDSINSEVYVRQYGMFGRMLGLNIAYVRPNTGSSELIKKILKEVDRLPHARKIYSPFQELTGPQLITSSNEAARTLRRHFVTALPSPEKVLESAITITRKHLQNIQDRKWEEVTSHVHIIILSREILLSVLLDCEWTFEINQLISKISSRLLLLRGADEPLLEQDYKLWVRTHLETFLSSDLDKGSSALAKAVKRIKEAKENEHNNEDDLQNILANDPTIHALFTSLVTNLNIYYMLTNILNSNFSETTKVFMKKIQAQLHEKGFSPDASSKHNLAIIRDCTNLDCLYKESLYMQLGFHPSHLHRYVSADIDIDGALIPAGTTLIIDYNQQDEKKSGLSFNPSRFESENAPQLGSNFFAPFSVGDRKCPGQRIAEYLYKGVVAMICVAFDENFNELKPADTEVGLENNNNTFG